MSFRRGFNLPSTSSNTPRTPRTALEQQIGKMKSRKSKPIPNNEQIRRYIDELPISDNNVKNKIKMMSLNVLNKSQKSSISRGARNIRTKCSSKKLLETLHVRDDYKSADIIMSINVFKELEGNLRFQRRYVQALEEIGIPNKKTFNFLSEHWKDIVKYISNREEPVNEYTRHFLDMMCTNPPSKLNFKQIVLDVEDYVNLFNYDE
tara:strand:+ start:6822 stop:7439 length:618 start_codon:yes stop_codon:yes gene_type:complete